MSGGGGGDGGAANRAAAMETKKAKARAQLNALFGETSPLDKAQFDLATNNPVIAVANKVIDQSGPDGEALSFDQKGYNAALAQQSAANPNKAAREQLYAGVRDNAFNAGKRSLDETKENAQRQNKFALFAQGLNGSSTDIDQSALLGRTYDKGLLDLGAKADGARTEFKTNDENTRLGLLQAIEGGIDQSSAISSAINQMKNNSDAASSTAQSTSLGDLFAQSGALYTQSQKAKGTQAATDWWNDFNGGGGSSKGNSTARTGVATRTY